MNIFLNSTDNISDKLCFTNINNKNKNNNNIYFLYSNIKCIDNIINKINKSNIIKTNIYVESNFSYSNNDINKLIDDIYDKELNSKNIRKI